MMPKLSAGRVQSVATRLVVERERARMAFRAAEYWDIEGRFAASGAEFPASLVELDGKRVAIGPRLRRRHRRHEQDVDERRARSVVPTTSSTCARRTPRSSSTRLRDVDYRVASVESSPFTEKPTPPFTTSTLQQEAGRKLRFSTGRTMSVAQGLYERGYITYMRTDSHEPVERGDHRGPVGRSASCSATRTCPISPARTRAR